MEYPKYIVEDNRVLKITRLMTLTIGCRRNLFNSKYPPMVLIARVMA